MAIGVVVGSREVISLDEAKNHLRVDSGDDNELITRLITAAREWAEGYAEMRFISRNIELVYDSAPAVISIPERPISEVTKIETISEAGVKTEVSDALYTVDLAGPILPGRVWLNSGCTWPTHRGIASFLITVVAGYGAAASDVPAQIRQAILIYLTHLYENRGDEGSVKARVQAVTEAETLLRPYRLLRI